MAMQHISKLTAKDFEAVIGQTFKVPCVMRFARGFYSTWKPTPLP